MRFNSRLILSCLAASCVSASFAVEKNGASLTPYEIPGQGFIQNLSDNGEWAVWAYPSGDEVDAKPCIIDVAKREMLSLPVEGEQATDGSKARCNDISDDGKTIVGIWANAPAYYKTDDKKWTYLSKPKAFGRAWQGEVLATTPDARVMVGWVYQSFTLFKGVAWIDGKPKENDTYNLPDYEEMFELGIIDKAQLEEHHANNLYEPNFMFRQVSADGKKVVVGVDHNYPNWGASYLIYDLEKDTYDWVLDRTVMGNDFVDGVTMSNNGKYAIAYTGESGCFLYDIEAKTFKRIGGGASLVDNYGNVYNSVGDYSGSPIASLSIPYGGLDVDMYQMLRQTYDINFAAVTGVSNTGTPMGISDDCKVMACMAIPRTNGYVVTLPKTFVESCEGVNLLTDWAASPVPGSNLAQFEKVTISLSYGCKVDDKVKAEIKDEAGKTVAQSSEITQGVRSNIWTISFPKQVFEDGKKYSVVIPKGLFFIEGTEFTNNDIVVEYVGRKNEPLAPVNITPKENEAIQDLSMTNAMYLTFNTAVVVTKDAQGAVYEKGSDNPISILVLEANGNMVGAYMPTGRKLALDKPYEVKIPAGAFTDVAGFCPNEEITVSYYGSYIPVPVGAFEEDFSSPNAALDKFLQYEGDHNTPTEEMAAWGFDAHNTPWNFSVHDGDGEMNYAAASHSKYEPAGKSDDWLVIPQLNIQNPDYYLKFNAQSYLKKSRDVLKVLVWECDELYSALDKDIVDRMRKEGKVILEQVLTPGANEQLLANDWQAFDISLAQFNGKKIYIAFVNENENQSAVFIDDILVQYRGKFDVSISTDPVVVGQNEVEIKAAVINNQDGALTSIKASYASLTNDSKGEFEISNLDIKKGQSYQFVFPEKMKLDLGVENRYTLDVTVGDATQSFNASVKNLSEPFKKMVVIEEVTGAWCGNCPQGNIAFEYLEKQFPGQVLPIAVHNNDRWAYPAYEAFVAGNGYPSGRVNRGAITAPMLSGKFSSETGDQTWYDIAAKELETPADTRVKIKDFYFCLENQQFEVLFDVDFAIEKKNMSYNVLAVVLEDELPIVQTNYFAEQTDPVYGEWGAGGKFGEASVETVANHVPRGIAGTSFYGFSGLIPRNAKIGEVTKTGIQFTPVATYHWDDDKMTNEHISVACIVLDGTSGNVINADVFHGIEVREASGIDDVITDSVEGEANISFSVTGGKVLANGSENNVEVYTLSGARVANRGLNGLYIVRATDESGNAASAKILVK